MSTRRRKANFKRGLVRNVHVNVPTAVETHSNLDSVSVSLFFCCLLCMLSQV